MRGGGRRGPSAVPHAPSSLVEPRRRLWNSSLRPCWLADVAACCTPAESRPHPCALALSLHLPCSSAYSSSIDNGGIRSDVRQKGQQTKTRSTTIGRPLTAQSIEANACSGAPCSRISCTCILLVASLRYHSARCFARASIRCFDRCLAAAAAPPHRTIIARRSCSSSIRHWTYHRSIIVILLHALLSSPLVLPSLPR
jgi:hypothetical protein